MAKDNKKLVQAITSQEENFAQWYTDICVKAELVEYSSVKGFIILRPYGQAIWELIQKDMDARFKATGHENVAMPVLIPESLLQKEGELVNGQRTPYYAGGRRRYCVQSAGKHASDGKENRQDNLQGSCPFQQYQHRNHER